MWYFTPYVSLYWCNNIYIYIYIYIHNIHLIFFITDECVILYGISHVINQLWIILLHSYALYFSLNFNLFRLVHNWVNLFVHVGTLFGPKEQWLVVHFMPAWHLCVIKLFFGAEAVILIPVHPNNPSFPRGCKNDCFQSISLSAETTMIERLERVEFQA